MIESEALFCSYENLIKRGLFDSLGGRSENDVVLKCISKVIQRPQLAQHFNCGGVAKSGTLLLKPTDKENFMGSQCQKIILRVLRKKYPRENESSIRTRASDVLKRSSGLKGVDAYRAKKLKLKKVNKKPQQIPCDDSPDSSDSDSSKQKRQKISSDRSTVSSDASVSKDVI